VAESVDANAISSAMLATGAVGSNQLAAESVTSAKLGTSAVLSANIGDSNVTTGKIANLNVTTDKIADLNVTTAKIADLNVTTAKIANNAVDNTKLRDSAGLSVIGRTGSTTGDPADIVAGSDGQVLRRAGTSVGFGTVGTDGITDAAVTTEKIASGVNLAAGMLSATGNVTIGSSATTRTLLLNNKPVPVAEENLRIIRGTVTGGAVITSGTGFTAAIQDSTKIRVSFPTGTFSSAPSVVVSPVDTSVGWTQYVTGITSTAFYSGAALSGGSYGRQNFTFIAIGPR